MAQSYNDPTGGQPSTVGPQIVDYIYSRKAIISEGWKKVFTPLANRDNIPKHKGKRIRKYVYYPLLHDANINDQGIDANGVTTTREVSILIKPPGLGVNNVYLPIRANGEGADAATALDNAKIEAEAYFKSVGLWDTDYDTTKAALEGLAEPWEIVDTLDDVPNAGNMYGSSTDINAITEHLPVLGEHGGRYNRVGLVRDEIESTIAKFGFFFEYSKDSLNFDTDAELMMHYNRELIRGANEMQEAAVQKDLLNAAGIRSYTGEAVSRDTLSGNTGSVSALTYRDFTNLTIDLDDNECPTQTKMVTGSTKIDTRVILDGRIMYCSNKLNSTLEEIQTPFGEQALIRSVHYASAGKLLNNEFGTVGGFRIVNVPAMQSWRGAGADVTTNEGYYETNGKYDVFPLLVVGSDAFSIIGFEGSKSKMGKFEIIHKKPGYATADRTDPYGQDGFISFLWWYGFLAEKPERIAVIHTVARYS